MRFASGAVGALEINSHVPAGHPTAGQATVTVIGVSGMIELDLAKPWLTLSDERGVSLSQGTQKDLWFREEIEAFARHVGAGSAERVAREIPLRAVQPGMTIMQDLRTHMGTLLVPRGFEVTATFLERIRNYGPDLLAEKIKVLSNG